MAASLQSLSSTKPLADPLRVFGAAVLTVNAATFFLFPKPTVPLLYFTYLTAIGFVILTVPLRRPNAIYLRAFRSDRNTRNLRVKLAIALGPGFRLAGIRPPRERASIFTRFFLPNLFAVRYGGTTYMELEADDDWTVRLWRTYHETRVVFIDVRELTAHVRNEIELTLRTMGCSRCVFVISDDQTETGWRVVISSIVPAENPANFVLLDADSQQLTSEVRKIVGMLPAGAAAIQKRARISCWPMLPMIRLNAPSVCHAPGSSPRASAVSVPCSCP